VVLLIVAVPVPFRSVAEGVVSVPEEGMVRTGVDGFVAEVLVQPGQRVSPGDPLIRLREPLLATELQVLNARLRELDARYREGMTLERVKLELIREEQRYVRQQLARVQERTDELVIRSRAEGVFVLPRAVDLPGRFARQGDVLAHVLSQETTTVRTVVPQQDIHLVRERTRSVQVRLAEELARVFPGAVTRVVPAASDELPAPALGSQGGGALAVDPSDPEGRKAVQRFFQVELTLPHEGTAFVGGHAFVRFDFGWEPLGTQWYRQVRQLFLARFNV
jgi:putative peptide zinc metalloprotease protein